MGAHVMATTGPFRGDFSKNALVAVAAGGTYRSVLGNREFSALLFSQALSVIGDQLVRLAIALLVFERTGSAFAASATYAASYLVYLLGGPFLATLGDRYPRTTVMVVADLVRAPIVLALCLDGLPLWTFFVAIVAVGAVATPFESARSGLLADLLEGPDYVLGNGVISWVFQAGHVLGFVLGGATLAILSARGALALDAGTFLVSAGLVLCFIRRRPAAQPASDQGTLRQDTRDGFHLVVHDASLRRLLSYGLLSAGAIIAPEGLAVPVARGLGGGALAAGVLTAAVPAGYLVGSAAVLRLAESRRQALIAPLALLCCVPLLGSPLTDHLGVIAGLWFLAGVGGALNLISSAAYVQATPREFRSRAFGVAVTGLNAVQGLVLLAAGGLAALVGARTAVAVVAAVALISLGAATRSRLLDPEAHAQENSELFRCETR